MLLEKIITRSLSALGDEFDGPQSEELGHAGNDYCRPTSGNDIKDDEHQKL